MRIISIIFVASLLFGFILLGVDAKAQSGMNVLPLSEPYLVVLVENDTIEAGEDFNITIVLNNPTDYQLANISFWVEIPIDLEIISNTSTHPTEFTKTLTEEETYNITCYIKLIDKKSVYYLIFLVRGSKVGEYTIKLGDAEAVKVKGEYRKEIGIGSQLEVQLEVVKKKLPRYPPEGEKDATTYIVVFTILMPIGLLLFSRHIAWRTQ